MTLGLSVYFCRCSFVVSILAALTTLSACTKKSESGQRSWKGQGAGAQVFYLATPVGTKVIPAEQVTGDEFVVEGDIVVRREWLKSERDEDKSLGAFGDIESSRLWPTKTIPYAINGAPTPKIIQAALGEWASKTGVQFVARTTEADYLNFIPQAEIGGRAYVGRIYGAQSVWIGPECPHSCIAHEIGHALGLWHEHTRPDRDQYITVLWNNVRPEFRDSYDFLNSSISAAALGPYDASSVMHYASRSGGCIDTRRPCILRKNGTEIPYDKPVSDNDAAGIARRFKAVSERDATGKAYKEILGFGLEYASSNEWVNWFKHFSNGGTVEQMRASLATRPSVVNGISDYYKYILERDVASNEIQYWQDFLAKGGTYAGIRPLFADSPEAEKKIQSIYATILERDANGAELAEHRAGLRTVNASTIRVRVANSPETVSKLTSMYSKILKRPITTDDVKNLRVQLAQGTSLKQVRDQTIVSNEANAIVTKQFMDVLNRAPLDTERTEWQDALRKGDDTVALRSRLVDGLESRQGISAVYQKILEKDPSPEAAKKLADALRGGATRSEVRDTILDGNDVKKKIVRIMNELSGRDATAEKIAEHIAFLKGGKTAVELRAQIAAQSILVSEEGK